jgi:hypothetical protein
MLSLRKCSVTLQPHLSTCDSWLKARSFKPSALSRPHAMAWVSHDNPCQHTFRAVKPVAKPLPRLETASSDAEQLFIRSTKQLFKPSPGFPRLNGAAITMCGHEMLQLLHLSYHCWFTMESIDWFFSCSRSSCVAFFNTQALRLFDILHLVRMFSQQSLLPESKPYSRCAIRWVPFFQ